LGFLGWVLLLSIPFYVWVVLWPIELPLGIPQATAMIIVPALVGTVMTQREQGRGAAVELWRRIFDAGRAQGAWTVVAFFLMPVAMLISYGLMRWLGLAFPADVTRHAGAHELRREPGRGAAAILFDLNLRLCNAEFTLTAVARIRTLTPLPHGGRHPPLVSAAGVSRNAFNSLIKRFHAGS
jgi:hypothetical protein